MGVFRGILFFCITIVGLGAAAIDADDGRPFKVRDQVKITVRDGTTLLGALYLPGGEEKRRSTIVNITPYTTSEKNVHKTGAYFAKNGFAFLTVNMRGRGGSGGVFRPFTTEHMDGYDVIEWAAKQGWSNGRIGMWGGSYMGYTQWATAKSAPPHLLTIVPTASVYPGRDFPRVNGILNLYALRWLVACEGHTDQWNGFAGDDDYWLWAYRAFHRSGVGSDSFDVWAQRENTNFKTWVEHPNYDWFWKTTTPDRAAYRKMNIPVLTITGAYDDDQIGALRYYREHTNATDPHSDHYLLIGPWDHSGTRRPELEYEGIKFGNASKVDILEINKNWYEWILNGKQKPAQLVDKVVFYEQGLDKWVPVATLEGASSRTLSFRLIGIGQSNLMNPGGLVPVTGLSGEPAKMVLTSVDSDWEHEVKGFGLGGTMVQRDAAHLPCSDTLQSLSSSLVLETDPQTEVLEIAGQPSLSFGVRSNVKDADLFAALYEVFPDGSVNQLSSGVLRARFRDSLASPKGLPIGEDTLIQFSEFMWFSRALKVGSRLRLALGVVSDFGFQRNRGTGGCVGNEKPDGGQIRLEITGGGAGQHPTLTLPIR